MRNTIVFCIFGAALFQARAQAQVVVFPESLSTRSLFKRPVFDAARSPKEKLVVVSAGGIFRSRNGFRWEEIPLFGRKNQPVAFDKNGSLYVGTLKSTDGGDSFEPFIKWDELLKSVRTISSRAPHYIKIEKVIPKNKELQVLVDAGWNLHLLLSSKDQGSTWNFDSFQRPEAFGLEPESLAVLEIHNSRPAAHANN